MVLYGWFNKLLALRLFPIATTMEMITSYAGHHLLFTLLSISPFILLHAALQANEGFSITEDKADGHILDAAV